VCVVATKQQFSLLNLFRNSGNSAVVPRFCSHYNDNGNLRATQLYHVAILVMLRDRLLKGIKRRKKRETGTSKTIS
jgi:hypothetical protein